MKSFTKNETLKELRTLLIENVEKDNKLEKESRVEFHELLDGVLELVYNQLEKGANFNEIERTIKDFLIKKKEELVP
jgi:hypothetical protein